MVSFEALAACPAGRPEVAVALVGPGRVGRALLKRFRPGTGAPRLVAIANSSRMLLGADLDEDAWLTADDEHEHSADLSQLVAWLERSARGQAVLVDATASAEVAEYHADWLKRGLTVVTANKWALAAPSLRWQALERERLRDPTRYQAAATVGAGLPVLSTLDRLRQSGETVHGVGGALSGTMSFLCGRISAGLGPSDAVVEAMNAGLTEPDPRNDLDGLDVARKLVILARAAGYPLVLEDVEVDSLVPPELREGTVEQFLQQPDVLDKHWQHCVNQAGGTGELIAHVGRFDSSGKARVGLERIEPGHLLAGLQGAGNLVEIRTGCYGEQPLVIAGPGAGIEVTALALWSGMQQSAPFSQAILA